MWLRAVEHATSADPARFVLPFSILPVDLFFSVLASVISVEPKTEPTKRHRTHRFSFMWETDRMLIPRNRSLQQPNKPNQFVG
jgi:hypothetical protein